MRSWPTSPTSEVGRPPWPSPLCQGAGRLPSPLSLQPCWHRRRPPWPRRWSAATSVVGPAAPWLGESPTGEDAASLEGRGHLVGVVPGCRWLVLRSRDGGCAPLQARR